MGATIKPEKVILPPDRIEREKIVNAGQSAREAGMPGSLNPYRDEERRKAWDEGFNNLLGITSTP
jgi:hypothetical protein